MSETSVIYEPFTARFHGLATSVSSYNIGTLEWREHSPELGKLTARLDQLAEVMDLMIRTVVALSEENDALKGRLGLVEARVETLLQESYSKSTTTTTTVYPSLLRGASSPTTPAYTSSVPIPVGINTWKEIKEYYAKQESKSP